MKKSLCVSAVVLAVTSMIFGQEGKKVVSHDGSCQISVPSSWTVNGNFGNATSPDKKVSATTSSPKMISSFAELKQNARRVGKATARMTPGRIHGIFTEPQPSRNVRALS